MLPILTSYDDVVLLVGADYFFELLHVAGEVWGWRGVGGEWWLIGAGAA